MQIRKSDKLKHVCYDIRGPVLAVARRLEDEGFPVAKLNIGDPAKWGFEAPKEILRDVTPSRSGTPPKRAPDRSRCG